MGGDDACGGWVEGARPWGEFPGEALEDCDGGGESEGEGCVLCVCGGDGGRLSADFAGDGGYSAFVEEIWGIEVSGGGLARSGCS